MLYIGKCDSETWRFSIHVLIEGGKTDRAPLKISSSDDGVQIDAPVVAAEFGPLGHPSLVYWSWNVSVARKVKSRRITYLIDADDAEFIYWTLPETFDNVVIPGQQEIPRLAFFSCNGEDEIEKVGRGDEQYALWEHLIERHESVDGGYHLLLGGGDQIYADCAWDNPDCPLHRLGGVTKFGVDEELTTEECAKVAREYIDIYARYWAPAKPPGEMFARIPIMFTWDDHDIFDGWGSYKPDRMASRVFQQVFEVAARTFEAFQLGGSAKLNGREPLLVYGNAEHYLQSITFDTDDAQLAIIMLDSRGGRTLDRVLSDSQWLDLPKLFDELAEQAKGKRRHLLFVSTLPVVYMRFDGVLKTMEAIPYPVPLEDDLHDHWESHRHRNEREQLILELLKYGKISDSTVTILSGDVHIGARGIIRSTDPDHVRDGREVAVVEQVTSSGIVSPPPPRPIFWCIRLFGREFVDRFHPGLEAHVIRVSKKRKFLVRRNYLTIESLADDDGSLKIEFTAERLRHISHVIID